MPSAISFLFNLENLFNDFEMVERWESCCVFIRIWISVWSFHKHHILRKSRKFFLWILKCKIDFDQAGVRKFQVQSGGQMIYPDDLETTQKGFIKPNSSAPNLIKWWILIFLSLLLGWIGSFGSNWTIWTRHGVFDPFNNLKFFERKSNFQLSQSGLKAPVHVYLD